MQKPNSQISVQALEWHLAEGVDEFILDEPQSRLKQMRQQHASQLHDTSSEAASKEAVSHTAHEAGSHDSGTELIGAVEAKRQAVEIVQNIHSLDELKEAIQNFEGLDIKKTATNLVFADGNPDAKVMLVGEAPGADEDRQGKPFMGVTGKLLDQILGCVGLSRDADDVDNMVYLTNMLNWRPPGNRSPTPQEMDISRPFIEKHIQLVQPEILMICGGGAAKILLSSSDSISKLRGKWQEYTPQNIDDKNTINAMVTYHPANLIETPAQKEKVWSDMLLLKRKRLDF